MALSTESRITSACGYSNIPEVNFVDPQTNSNSEAGTQELRLGYTRRLSGISFRMLAPASLLLAATVASLTWASSFGSLSSKSLVVQADGSDGLVLVGLAESANGSNGSDVGNSTEGDIRIMVCRDTNCDKFHPHGLVHEYTAFLNKCSTISSSRSKQTNGKYRIIGATASTIKPEMVLTAQHCNDNSSAPPVYHGPFSLTVGQFTDCCSFEHGGCGFKCITFSLNEVPPAYGGDGMDGGDIRIKVCRNEDCDKLHPHGLVHEYTANLNTCAKIPEDTSTKTNGEYQIIGAMAATLAQGTVLTAQQCGNTTEKVYHGPFSLILGMFTDCCSFRHGGCGFKCITFNQAYGEPAANETLPDNSTEATTTGPAPNTSAAVTSA